MVLLVAGHPDADVGVGDGLDDTAEELDPGRDVLDAGDGRAEEDP